jgi:hypothetical protein
MILLAVWPIGLYVYFVVDPSLSATLTGPNHVAALSYVAPPCAPPLSVSAVLRPKASPVVLVSFTSTDAID